MQTVQLHSIMEYTASELQNKFMRNVIITHEDSQLKVFIPKNSKEDIDINSAINKLDQILLDWFYINFQDLDNSMFIGVNGVVISIDLGEEINRILS